MSDSVYTYDQVDHGRLSEFDSYTVDLDVAQPASNPKEVLLQGEFVYLDDDSNGKVYIRFNDRNGHRFPIQAGAKYNNIKFKRVFLDWTAQTSKKVNIVYGQDANFTPTNDIANIDKVNDLRGLWYDRSLFIMANEFADSLVPHTSTVRYTYTVPTGKQSRFRYHELSIKRYLAPTTSGVVVVQLELFVSGIYMLFAKQTFNDATVGVSVSGADKHVDFLLAAGDQVIVTTYDLSVDGGVSYVARTIIDEYDV